MASGERFGYEWDAFQELVPEYEEQFLRWVAPLTKDTFRDITILDVGCGMGRNMYWPLSYGARHVTGVDVDERTLGAARRTLEKFSNKEVRLCSAYEIPDQNMYDLVYSIGVIHHLEKPKDAIARMVQAAKPGGTVLMWVYGKEGNGLLIPMVNLMRKILVPLPPFVTDAVSYLFAAPLWLWLKIVPQHKPYWKLLSTFRFWHLRSIVLDQFLPKVANYWTRDEALGLFTDIGLERVEIMPVNNMSWSVRGIKKTAE
jgi:SAM-dependent methyltransferase